MSHSNSTDAVIAHSHHPCTLSAMCVGRLTVIIRSGVMVIVHKVITCKWILHVEYKQQTTHVSTLRTCRHVIDTQSLNGCSIITCALSSHIVSCQVIVLPVHSCETKIEFNTLYIPLCWQIHAIGLTDHHPRFQLRHHLQLFPASRLTQHSNPVLTVLESVLHSPGRYIVLWYYFGGYKMFLIYTLHIIYICAWQQLASSTSFTSVMEQLQT